MNRRGQGISINVVIIAAIALLILVILSVLVIRSGGTINKGTGCQSTGGTCVSTLDNGGKCSDTSMSQDYGATCPNSADGTAAICCRKI